MRKALAILTLILLFIATTVGVYYSFVYLPEKRLEERIQPLIDAGLEREEALKFDETYGDWAPYNKTAAEFARYWVDYPVISEAILETSGSLKYTILSLDLIAPNIANKTLTQDIVIEFMVRHPLLVKDDGMNATDIQLIKYYVHLPGIVDKVIEKIKSQEDRLLALDELTPYIPKSLTEEQAYHLIGKWYPELFRACMEKRIPIVFGDLDEDDWSNYDEIFIYGTDPIIENKPPLIEGLKWEPIKVVRSKVYEGAVSFTAKDKHSVIAEAHLTFIPKIYPHLRSEAFPNEAIRELDLKPLDGRFDESLENFLVNITDIKGGREYDIIVKVKDEAGNVDTENLTTPYIKEFENIGKELLKEGIIVGASYYLWWGPEYWAHNSPLVLEPLLGWYNSTDPVVISKHVDWATSFGINIFFVSWSGRSYEDTYYHDRRLKDVFLKHPIASEINFSILYETHGRLTKDSDGLIDLNKKENKRIFIEDFVYLAKNYFSNPSYLRIRGRPVIYTYDTPVFTLKTPNVEEILKEMRTAVRDAIGEDIYLISSEVNKWFDPYDEATKKRLQLFECNSDWAAQFGGNPEIDKWFMDNYEKNLFNTYSNYSRVLKEMKRDFMPSTIPGFRNVRKEGYRDPQIIVDRDLERFKQRIKIALSTLQGEQLLIRFDTWNDHHENTQLEPSMEEKFSYLKVIREELPIIVPSRVLSNLDNYAGDWGVYTEGNPTWAKMNGGSPSRDGSSLKLSITGGNPYSNVHFYRNLGNYPTVSRIKYEIWFWFSNTTWSSQGGPSRIQAIEFSCSIFASPYRYEWALQWENVGDGTPDQGSPPTWRIWTGSGWSPLEIKVYLTSETWHHLVLFGKIDDGYVYYLGFNIDGTYYHLSSYYSPTSTSYNQLAIAVQLDGNYKQDAYDVYVESITLEVSKEVISF